MIEAMKQALEALEFDSFYGTKKSEAITSLRKAIQEEALRNVQRIGQEIEQEPVSYQSTQEKGRIETVPAQGGLLPTMREGKDFTITHPPQRTWQGLTHEQVDSWELPDCPTVFEFAQFIEAKLKQKNGFAEEKNT